MLSHTRNDLRATPDVSAILPFVRDVLLEEVVIHCRGNQAKASRLLGINRGTLRTHMARIHMKKLYEKRRRPNGT
ncbi:helix-turn-helix domain-containing protein [Vibrio owensii]|uniref:helix-turn-helix domain-containing protein n=1 Tax=Vibrio owensii TaxID=696485 RepID=UPI003CC80360